MLPVTGKAEFVDVTEQVGINEYTTSISATFFDDRDGKLDLLIGNSLAPYLPDYNRPTPLNIFKLPAPEYPKRSQDVSFHASHLEQRRKRRTQRPLPQYRQRQIREDGYGPDGHAGNASTAIGTGDLNGDGYTDLYCSSDFGPDDLYLNDHGKRFVRVSGKTFGSIGKDTYKGMNVTIADLDTRGLLDIYVSNVHVPLQAEGSLLWKTQLNPRNHSSPGFPR